MRLLHISDLHYTIDRGANAKTDAELKRLSEAYPDATWVCTGDMTDNGLEREYALAAASLTANAKAGLITCPGNHDEGLLGNLYSPEAAKRFERTFGTSSWPSVTSLNGVSIIALDSVCHTKSPLDFACGNIGFLQRWMLSFRLATNSGSTRIVILHHHPFYRAQLLRLLDSNKFMRTVAGRADLLLFGHRHETGRYDNKDGVKLALAAGKASDEKSRWLITIDGKSITAEQV